LDLLEGELANDCFIIKRNHGHKNTIVTHLAQVQSIIFFEREEVILEVATNLPRINTNPPDNLPHPPKNKNS
jgi:hypothetical protein